MKYALLSLFAFTVVSSCLGQFGPGQMVPEFDKVVFSAEVGTVQGPVQTQFGFHLLEVTERTD